MTHSGRLRFALLGAVAISTFGASNEPNAQPNPYRTIENYFKLPEGRTWGAVGGVSIDSHDHIWAAERCGGNTCAGSNLDPILEFDQSGKLLKSFGGGMFIFPHGLFIDKEDNIWVCDGQGKDGKGQQVIKFSPDGKILMTLGKKGVAGVGPDTFNMPSAVIVASNGDIFVADGHGGDSNARVVKFTADGKFIKAWGKPGSAPGDFMLPHGLAFDSKGRLFVCDRGNNRLQIFDQEGKLLDTWTQFGRPAGIFIDKHDNIFVADSDSAPESNPGWKRGLRIGRVKDAAVLAFIPDPGPGGKGTTAAESVAVDSHGVVYGAEVGYKDLKKYVKK